MGLLKQLTLLDLSIKCKSAFGRFCWKFNNKHLHAYLKVLWSFIIPFESKAFIEPNKIYFTPNKENSIRNTVRASMFQKLLAI